MKLEVKNLTYSQQHKIILNKLNFEVDSGNITAVLGKNGSGKSTLLRLLAALIEPDSGEINFNNEKVLGPASKLIAGHPGISLVRQDNRLFPFHTVRQNLTHILQKLPKEAQKDRILVLSTLLKLELNLDRTLSKLSGGEQQRVSIAAALAGNPHLLLMDEPFSHMDLNLKHQMKKHLTDIVQELGIGILFVTHDPIDALSLANKIAILEDGQIIEQGSGQELYFNAKNKTTALLTGYCNWIPAKKIKSPLFFPKIEDHYLVRPEKIQVHNRKADSSFMGTIEEIEFGGFYHAIYIFLEELEYTIITTVISLSPDWKKGSVIWITFN